MSSKSTSTIKQITPLVWQLICLAISITFFSLILLNRSPNALRPLSMALRTGFGLVIPATTLLVYLAFRIPGRLGNLIGMVITTCLFAMPLAGLWASGQTQTTILNGIIPFYDAESYYIDALGLTYGSKFSFFSSRRPLFPALLAVLLSWTDHNLMAALAILTGIVGLACYFAAREIQRTHGAEISVFILIILFLFFRAHSGVSMSENLGVALGVLGFALLWQGASNKNLLLVCSGLLTTTLALNARAGAFFMLPLLIAWAGWLFREKWWISWKSVLLATVAVVLGFGLNLVLTRIVAIPHGVPFANFSYTLFGLASGGKSWAYIFEAHPEVLLLPEPEQTLRIYELGFALVREQPLEVIKGALYNWRMLFSDSWYSIYSYVGGENWTINTFVSWAMYLLCIVGIYAWFQDRSDAIKSLIMISVLGVFISVPFLPPTDAYRMRPYAASIIILAALPALGLSSILQKLRFNFLSNPERDNSPFWVSPFYTVVLIFVTVMGPVILKSMASPAILHPISCTNEKSDFVLVRFDKGTYINIRRESEYFLDWMPDFHAGQFKANAHSLADPKLINWAESLEPPTTLFLSLDFHTNQKALIAFKTETPPEAGRYYQFCGNFEMDASLLPFRIFYAHESLPLSP